MRRSETIERPLTARAQEVFGEDPLHMSALVAAYVIGMQNNTLDSATGPDGQHVLAAACCKHFGT